MSTVSPLWTHVCSKALRQNLYLRSRCEWIRTPATRSRHNLLRGGRLASRPEAQSGALPASRRLSSASTYQPTEIMKSFTEPQQKEPSVIRIA
ncbi:hypothetical protein EYF80_047470 [Liparis tanakae]|uniref:Uncharacterized protein n=1 Tax=Liparis tanakae TaxID=230148 RepID=A0A4Z2FNA2_9TELE|nr:hypothetical protein EYF80_047470 [Liparis tanakae]